MFIVALICAGCLLELPEGNKRSLFVDSGCGKLKKKTNKKENKKQNNIGGVRFSVVMLLRAVLQVVFFRVRARRVSGRPCLCVCVFFLKC